MSTQSPSGFSPPQDIPKKKQSEGNVNEAIATTPGGMLSPQPQPNASFPSTPMDVDLSRPTSSGPEEQAINNDSSKSKCSEPEHIIELSPSQRYGKVTLLALNCS